MFTTIIFDLADVYICGILGLENKLAKKLNINPVIISKWLHNRDLKKLFIGKISEKEYWKRFLERYKIQMDISELKKVVRENFSEIEGVKEIIIKLKKEYKIGLLSDHAKEWIKYCKRKFMFDNLFEVEIYSFQIGVTKPHRKAFELILNALASKPSKCIFIDDQDINLLAAKKIGMSPVKFINPNQLLYSLKNLEVKISGF